LVEEKVPPILYVLPGTQLNKGFQPFKDNLTRSSEKKQTINFYRYYNYYVCINIKGMNKWLLQISSLTT
jgi:hypothetical protein